jgi:hypothetical protein
MSFTFARAPGAAIKICVEDVYLQARLTWGRLHEKGGKIHEFPCYHKLDKYLHQYSEKKLGQRSKKIPKGFCSRTVDWNTRNQPPGLGFIVFSNPARNQLSGYHQMVESRISAAARTEAKLTAESPISPANEL